MGYADHSLCFQFFATMRNVTTNILYAVFMGDIASTG